VEKLSYSHVCESPGGNVRSQTSIVGLVASTVEPFSP